MGAMASMMAPSYGSRGWAGGTLDWWPKARPPLWQYFSYVLKGRGVHRCPQRARTPDPCGLCPCKPATFGEPPEGAMIAIVNPPRQADAVVVGEGHAPVGGSTCRLR